MTPYDRMAADLAESKPKIEAALDKLAEAGMPFLDLRQERTDRITTGLVKRLGAEIAEAIRRAGADPSETHRFTKSHDAQGLASTLYVDGKPVLWVGPPETIGDEFTVPFRHLLP